MILCDNKLNNENNSPLVSIITTTYKKYGKLEDTIASVCAQDYKQIEYIISDDGSENFDKSYVEQLIKKYKRENITNVIIIHHQENLGTVRNISLATQQANGEYVISIGADDVFVNDNVISRIVERMLEKQCEILSFTRIQKSLDGRILRKMPHESFYGKIKSMNSAKKQYRALVTGFYYEFASGSSICSKRSTLTKMGYYDDNYKYWEDGPYLAKCNYNGIIVETAYDIDGIIYQLGGISSKKTTVESKAVKGLRDDAFKFYKSELEREPSLLTKEDKRKIKYALLRNRCNSKKKYLYMLMYLDVVFLRFYLKIQMKRADNSRK